MAAGPRRPDIARSEVEESARGPGGRGLAFPVRLARSLERGAAGLAWAEVVCGRLVGMRTTPDPYRGMVMTYDSIRAWGQRFARAFANTLKRRRPRPGDK
jgi:hypothetical protein